MQLEGAANQTVLATVVDALAAEVRLKAVMQLRPTRIVVMCSSARRCPSVSVHMTASLERVSISLDAHGVLGAALLVERTDCICKKADHAFQSEFGMLAANTQELLPVFLASLRRLTPPADSQLLVFAVDAAALAACRRQHPHCLARSGRATCNPTWVYLRAYQGLYVNPMPSG